MATINLGAIKFNWRGAYNSATAYAVDDVVSSGGSSYICILASTGNAVSNGTYWEQMSSAGTNGTDGTDLTTTLTTQGDIVYRDGSGLQRLAKGTANQTLQMNAGATAPTWVTADSGNTVKLAQYTHSSNVTSFQINNIGFDDSVYAYYRWNYVGSLNASSGVYSRWVDSSGNPITSSSYRLRGWDSYRYEDGTSATIGNWNSGVTPDNKMGIRTWGKDPDGDALQFGYGNIIRQAGKYTMWDNISTGTDDSGNGGWNFSYYASWEYQNTTAPVGIEIYAPSASAQFLSGTQFTIWGIKK